MNTLFLLLVIAECAVMFAAWRRSYTHLGPRPAQVIILAILALTLTVLFWPVAAS